MIHNYSSYFQKNKDLSFINLNNGTLGLCPDVVTEQQKNEIDACEKNTTAALTHSFKRLLKIQDQMAKFFGGSGQDYFLRPNVTLVMNEMIMGLKMPPSSEILSTVLEYGAILNILKYKADREDLKLKVMNMDFVYQNSSPEAWVQAIENELTPQTKLVVLSHVYTSNGLIAPIDEIGKVLREKGIVLVVDGAHTPGLKDLDFSKLSHVDYYGGNLHKWMMGPKGTAFGWTHPQRQPLTFPLYGSWTTDPEAVKLYGDANPYTVRMLWSHSQSFSAYFALEACFQFWTDIGKERIQAQITERLRYLHAALEKSGLNPVFNLEQAGFLAYRKEDFKPLPLHENIVVTPQGRVQIGLPKVPGIPLLRLTPHIHNAEEELDRAVQILVGLKK